MTKLSRNTTTHLTMKFKTPQHQCTIHPLNIPPTLVQHLTKHIPTSQRPIVNQTLMKNGGLPHRVGKSNPSISPSPHILIQHLKLFPRPVSSNHPVLNLNLPPRTTSSSLQSLHHLTPIIIHPIPFQMHLSLLYP